ncbi:MAG: hypothetical protein WCV63_04245 [Negativicutes bacterium]|jgi:Skp family chaperone for outer membrane proteins
MKKIIALIVLCLFIFSASAAFAESSTIGYVNLENTIQQSKKLQKLTTDFDSFQNQIVADFNREKVGLSEDDARIKAAAYEDDIQMRKQMAEARIDSSIRTAIKLVAKNLGLEIVVTNGVAIYGCKDITADVIKIIDIGQD